MWWLTIIWFIAAVAVFVLSNINLIDTKFNMLGAVFAVFFIIGLGVNLSMRK